jgi:hypothetical protein
VHATVEVKGRFQVFLAPGAMLVRQTGERGDGGWKPAADWGVTYRLMNLRMTDRLTGVLHFNFVRLWLFGQPGVSTSQSVNLAGFSMSFRRAPR